MLQECNCCNYATTIGVVINCNIKRAARIK